MKVDTNTDCFTEKILIEHISREIRITQFSKNRTKK